MEENWLVKKFNLNREKIVLIPNGIPKEYLKRRNKTLFRKKYDIKKNELMVMSLSRIHKSKGLDLVVRIAGHFPRVKFVIAGVDGGYLDELKSLKQKLDCSNVIFIGAISEKLKLETFSSADIFLFPSHYEGFGIVVLESFSQKTPVLSSNAGALPWVVGNAGLVFRDNDIEDLKNKLDLLVYNKKLRSKYSKLGYERAKQFLWEEITDKLEEQYSKLQNKRT